MMLRARIFAFFSKLGMVSSKKKPSASGDPMDTPKCLFYLKTSASLPDYSFIEESNKQVALIHALHSKHIVCTQQHMQQCDNNSTFQAFQRCQSLATNHVFRVLTRAYVGIIKDTNR